MHLEVAAERRVTFSKEFVSNGFNGTQAAIAAGCPRPGARVAAVRLLKEPETQSAVIEAIWDRLDGRRRKFVQAYTGWCTGKSQLSPTASEAARIAGCPPAGSRVAAYRMRREPLVARYVAIIVKTYWEKREMERRRANEEEFERYVAKLRRLPVNHRKSRTANTS